MHPESLTISSPEREMEEGCVGGSLTGRDPNRGPWPAAGSAGARKRNERPSDISTHIGQAARESASGNRVRSRNWGSPGSGDLRTLRADPMKLNCDSVHIGGRGSWDARRMECLWGFIHRLLCPHV